MREKTCLSNKECLNDHRHERKNCGHQMKKEM